MQKQFRLKILAYLKRTGTTKNKLARSANVEPSSLYRFLGGKSINVSTLEKIERAMK